MSVKNFYANLLANGVTSSFDWDGRYRVNVVVSGTFGSGTLKMQFSVDSGTTWIDVDASDPDLTTTFTANGSGNAALPKCLLRGNLTGATSPDLDITISPVSF